ncbi:MAG TPA: DNA translocase FtsK [Bacteroidales bacterium]|nr:DNA translocase FtsK [Bacteroidales bacterium]
MKKSKEEPKKEEQKESRKDEPGKAEPGKKPKKAKPEKKSFLTDERIKFIFGVLLTGFAIYLVIALIAYLFWWKTDLSLDSSQVISGADVQVKNWSGKSGAWFAMILVDKGFGFGAFFIPVIVASIGLFMLNFPKIKVWRSIFRFTFATIILSLILGFVFGKSNGYLGSGPGGAHGYLVTQWANAFMGKIGTAVILVLITVAYLIFALGVSPAFFRLRIPSFLKKKEKPADPGESVLEETGEIAEEQEGEEENENEGELPGQDEEIHFQVIDTRNRAELEEGILPGEETPEAKGIIHDFENEGVQVVTEGSGIPINITKAEANDILPDEEVRKIMENYDPRLDLPRYKFPPVSILADHRSESSFDNAEVIENKENIIKTLGDHKIPIRQISATVGPTVTLYEIVPERGVKIAKIKALENDIALNLSALGIRIIAPIPGRGTVGIEVPNKKPETVSMRSLVTSKAFQETKFDLALALGRTITNDPFIVDLTKMPHLLVAGATGQGKSVGINTIITSILYKKHPAEVKFVLIDPKRVELPLYMKIERHFLAKLPGDEDAIITDTQKVINTLNSLCIEMDNRLELLKMAQARHIKEYNEKFIARRLNPEKGHKFMPYIVLIIDEFADLIMTAGREIEGPIGRLAQLARAIGIHLIISTQRPSTNIITGFIKANFPTRIAFRVFSSVDSRTILDATGADRLVGRGDMLVSSGNEPVRVQCAFIDTPEIEELTEFIGSQQGYPDAMHLPEYIDDSETGLQDIDLKKRDSMFDEAARLVVQHQQGSTSLIQRKLSIGYNRAGRIIDQLEAAGVVGPFEGSKARDVLVSDLTVLEQILKRLE